jgi:hypothetical protein
MSWRYSTDRPHYSSIIFLSSLPSMTCTGQTINDRGFRLFRCRGNAKPPTADQLSRRCNIDPMTMMAQRIASPPRSAIVIMGRSASTHDVVVAVVVAARAVRFVSGCILGRRDSTVGKTLPGRPSYQTERYMFGSHRRVFGILVEQALLARHHFGFVPAPWTGRCLRHARKG